MALYTLKSGATAHPEASVLQFITDHIRTPGVLSVIGNHFKVSQQTSPDMTVKAAAGQAYLRKTSTVYPGRSDASANATITENSSGNPRKDAVVLYIDTGATPNSDASNVLKIVVVPGTAAASPVAPTDSSISSSIGANNPFLRLANVTVASGAGSIVDANIEDTRVNATLKKNSNEIIENTDGATVTFDISTGNIHIVTLGGNRTLALSNVSVGDIFRIKLKQDGTGDRTVTWFSGITWENGAVPVLSKGANSVDTFEFLCTGTGTYDGRRIFGVSKKRVTSITSSATPTPNVDTDDAYQITALAAGATFGAPTGTPINGQALLIRIKDNGTARALSFNAAYRFSTDIPAPTTTVLGKTMYLGFVYNSADSKWDCVALVDNF